MNMQQIMQQAQRMQKDITNKKSEIDSMTFVGKSDFVTITLKGNRDIVSVEITNDDAMNLENKEILCDMFAIALKDALKKIEDETEKKLGAYANIGGMF